MVFTRTAVDVRHLHVDEGVICGEHLGFRTNRILQDAGRVPHDATDDGFYETFKKGG